MVAQIFKKKYFSNGTFLDTPLGKKPSYAWRSIWNAKALLQEGIVWRVGDGRSIAIWGDRWMLTETTHAVQSPSCILGVTAKVCELIDSTTNWWNIPLVETVFNLEEARIICGMTICPRMQKIRLCGVQTSRGNSRSEAHITLLRRWGNKQGGVLQLQRPCTKSGSAYGG
jgi:hypothetical protein